MRCTRILAKYDDNNPHIMHALQALQPAGLSWTEPGLQPDVHHYDFILRQVRSRAVMLFLPFCIALHLFKVFFAYAINSITRLPMEFFLAGKLVDCNRTRAFNLADAFGNSNFRWDRQNDRNMIVPIPRRGEEQAEFFRFMR
jgi:hypothetical protein